MAKLFEKEDCSLCEVNPLVVTGTGDACVALDSKINFDPTPRLATGVGGASRTSDEEDPVELEAKEAGLSYVSSTATSAAW
ncbi:MAG: hypothetical protein R3B07_10595 [Polyangiaceae bacterium]